MRELSFFMDLDLAKKKAAEEVFDLKIKKHILEILEDGFTIIPADSKLLNIIDNAVKEFYEFKTNNSDIVKKYENENGYLHRIVNLHMKLDSLGDLFEFSTDSLSVLDFFLNETIIYTSLFFERGSEQDLHRDTPYFCTMPEYQYMGFWIALEDTDENNGSLKVVRGAHKLPELDRLKIVKKFYEDFEEINPYDMRLWLEYHEQLKEQYTNAGLKEEEVHFKKGDAVIWHPQTPHGAAKILKPENTRLSFVMHVTPPDVPVYKQDVFFTYKDVSDKANWNYDIVNKRKYIKHEQISFAHIDNYNLNELK
jgi:hypothetical protein